MVVWTLNLLTEIVSEPIRSTNAVHSSNRHSVTSPISPYNMGKVSYEIIADHLTALSSNRCCHCWHHHFLLCILSPSAFLCGCADRAATSNVRGSGLFLVRRQASQPSNGSPAVAGLHVSGKDTVFATIHSLLSESFFTGPPGRRFQGCVGAESPLHKINRQHLPRHPRIA